MSDKIKTVIFCDTENTKVDEEYAKKLIQYVRNLLNWKVEKDSNIYKALIEFSKGYSKQKRDVVEVAFIFALAHDIVK